MSVPLPSEPPDAPGARRVRPGVERDRREADAGADLGTRVADLERPGHPLRVVRREPLARPAVRDEAAVEPAVCGLVEDDQGIGPVRDLDPAVGGREQAGVPAGGPAHRLLDDRLPGLRPREPDRVAQPRQRLAEQRADPRAPRRVVAPAAQQEVDLVVARRHRERRLLEHGVLLRAQVREVVQRLAEGLGRQERPAVRGLRLAVERPALHVDRVARREADLHAAPARPVGRERPDRERHEAAADADLPARRPTRVDEVERELQRPRSPAVQAPEVDPEQGRVLRSLGHRDRGPLRAGDAEPAGARLDGQERVVEVVLVRPGLATVVAHVDRHRDPDAALRGLDRVGRVRDQREIGRGRRDALGGRHPDGGREPRERDGDEEGGDERPGRARHACAPSGSAGSGSPEAIVPRARPARGARPASSRIGPAGAPPVHRPPSARRSTTRRPSATSSPARGTGPRPRAAGPARGRRRRGQARRPGAPRSAAAARPPRRRTSRTASRRSSAAGAGRTCGSCR